MRRFRVLFGRPDAADQSTMHVRSFEVEAREIDGAMGVALARIRTADPEEGWSRLHVVAVVERSYAFAVAPHVLGDASGHCSEHLSTEELEMLYGIVPEGRSATP